MRKNKNLYEMASDFIMRKERKDKNYKLVEWVREVIKSNLK